MNKTGDLLLLRTHNPVSETRGSDWANSDAGSAVFSRIEAIARTAGSSPPSDRRSSRRRSVGGLIVAAVMVGAGAVAAAVATSLPDAQQSAQVEQDFSSQAQLHPDGWRPQLDAEAVWCLFPQTDGPLSTSASEFPLGQPLTSELLARECAEGNDWARKLQQDGVGPFDASTATVCVTEDTESPKAVVGVGGVDCSTTPIKELIPEVDAPSTSTPTRER